MNLEEMKKLYESEPENWVVYLTIQEQYVKATGSKPDWDNGWIYNIICKEHEPIADAVIANPDVKLEWSIDAEKAGFLDMRDFFNMYDSEMAYRLKPQKQDFSGGYIEASQEAYDLLVESGYNPLTYFKVDEWDWIFIESNSDINSCKKDGIHINGLKQFYINNGALSWEKPSDEKTTNDKSSTITSSDDSSTIEELKETISISDEDGKVYEFEKPEFKIRNDKGNKVTKKGLIGRIYNTQKDRCKKKEVPLPTYSREWLTKWLRNQDLFHILYQEWVDSEYDKMKKPSIDRLNDYISYTETNIQLMTWEENCSKHYEDRKSGRNTKHSKAVVQFRKDGTLVKIHKSISLAERETDIHGAEISKCITRYRNREFAGGYGWRPATKQEVENLFYNKEG